MSTTLASRADILKLAVHGCVLLSMARNHAQAHRLQILCWCLALDLWRTRAKHLSMAALCTERMPRYEALQVGTLLLGNDEDCPGAACSMLSHLDQLSLEFAP